MGEIDWTHLGLYSLVFYVPIAPFAYKFARDKAVGRAAALAISASAYVLVFLWIAGGSLAVFGMGMAFDRPGGSCGIGCIDPAEGHWQMPNFKFLLIGLLLIAAAWWLGKAMETFQEWSSGRAAQRLQASVPRGTFDYKKHEEEDKSLHELAEAMKRKEFVFPPLPDRPKRK
jgi:hypothetical protein